MARRAQLQKLLARVAAKASTGEFFYSRFFAIGVFRLLELTETRDPKALEALVKVRATCRHCYRLPRWRAFGPLTVTIGTTSARHRPS